MKTIKDIAREEYEKYDAFIVGRELYVKDNLKYLFDYLPFDCDDEGENYVIIEGYACYGFYNHYPEIILTLPPNINIYNFGK